MTTYSTRDAAFAYVVTCIENGQADANDYDIDEIIDACFEYDPSHGSIQNAGFRLTADTDTFWKAVEDALIVDFPAYFDEQAEDEIGDDGEPTGRSVLTMIVTFDGHEADAEAARLQYVTDDPESPEDLDELTIQMEEQGWKILDTPLSTGRYYRVGRIEG